MGYLRDYGFETSENIELKLSLEASNPGIDRREWATGDVQVTCFIWCGNIPFCHMVSGVLGLRGMVILGYDV